MSGKIVISQKLDMLAVSNGIIKIEYCLSKGLGNYYYGSRKVISDFYSEFAPGQGERVKSIDFANHSFDEGSIKSLDDGFGRGLKLEIDNNSGGGLRLLQSVCIYEDMPYFILQAAIAGEEELSVNYTAPLCTAGRTGRIADPGADSGTKLLFVPYDNDKWIRYEAKPAEKGGTSYEVTAVYDSLSRRGLVTGSLTHDVWKTGISLDPDEEGTVGKLTVYNGAADEMTRDTQPHGQVRGKRVDSSRIFVGFYDNYPEGLLAFAEANAKIEPPLHWNGGVPFGWNSWAALESTINYSKYIKTSDFIKEELQQKGFSNENVVYVNYDSFWTSLAKEKLAESVRHVNKNGQKAGIYFTPFAFWGKNFDVPVEGTGGNYRYSDIVLRDSSGNILPALDGGYATDPTHPGNLKRVEAMLNYFIDLGFEYVKLDFMAHGALEGVHYQKEITTGIMAYNYGMAQIRDLLKPERAGRDFFINLSIAPLFPYQYAHSRRISCDAFGSIADSEYMLNSVTYGWWINNTLYRFNDPDHIVLNKSFNRPSISEEEAKSRFNASVIAGTVLLFSEDIRSGRGRERCRKYLLNEKVNRIARKGVSFRPLMENEDSRAANIFILKEDQHICYLALFNYNTHINIELTVNLSSIFRDHSPALYEISDLWDEITYTTGMISKHSLKACQSKLLKLTRIKEE